MKIIAPACAFGMVILVSVFSTANAEMGMATAMSNCNEEARSTGLEDEADIKAYVDLCAQAWQSPREYTEEDPASEEIDDQDDQAVETPEELTQ